MDAVFAAVAAVAAFFAEHALARIVAKIALTVIASSLASGQRPSDAALLDPANFNQLTSADLTDRVIVYGETALAGEIVFQHLLADRKRIAYVIALADGGQVNPHELIRTEVAGETVTFDGAGGIIGDALGDYAGAMNLRFKGGHPNQTYDGTLASVSDGKWTENHRGRSCAYAMLTIDATNQDAFPTGGLPPVMFVIRGRRVYDPRLDSTKPGGSGAHRIDDESTWEWSNNAALCAYDYARGVYVNGKRIAGGGLPTRLIDEDWVIASANVCDTRGWQINGPTLAGADPALVLDAFAVQMGGRIAQRKGKLAIIAGNDWAPALTIAADDLAGPLRLQTSRSWRDTANATRASYRDPDAQWGQVETRQIKVDTWIAEDNGEVFERNLVLPYETRRTKSAQLAKINLYRDRAPRTILAPFKLMAAEAGEGESVHVTIPAYGIDEDYEVTRRGLDPTGFVQMELRLYPAAEALAWSDAEAGDPLTFARIDRPSLRPETPVDWTATAVAISSGTSNAPAILVAGEPPDWIDSVLIEWRETGDTVWRKWNSANPDDPHEAIITGVAAAKGYDISVRYRFRRLFSARQTLSVTTLSTLQVTQASSITGQGDLATLNGDDVVPLPPGIHVGAVGDVKFTKNRDSAGGVDNGEVRIQGTTIYAADVGVQTISQTWVKTPMETSGAIAGQGYIVLSATAAQTRFAGWDGVSGPLFFCKYAWSTGIWTAYGDTSVHAMTPAEDDVIVAVIKRPHVSPPAGIDKLGSLVFRNASLLTEWVTANGTAAAFVGQGALATQNSVTEAYAAIGVGKNCAVDGQFSQASEYWFSFETSAGSVTDSIASANGLAYWNALGAGFTSGEQVALVMGNVSTLEGCLICEEGDRVEVSGYIGKNNASASEAAVQFLDSAGALISTHVLASSTAAKVGGGALSTYARLGGFYTAPANTAFARAMYLVTADASAPRLRLTRPYIGFAGSAQTALTKWNIGFDAVPGADVTSANTAAAITGQGALATQSSVTEAYAALGVGKNCVIDGKFFKSTAYWFSFELSAGSVTDSVATANGLTYWNALGSGFTSGDVLSLVMGNSSTLEGCLICAAGDRVEVSGYVGKNNASLSEVAVQFLDSAGAVISIHTLDSSTATNNGGGALSTYAWLGGFYTAPANTAYARAFYMITASAGNPRLRVTRPYIGFAGSAQTAKTKWNVGFDAVPGADITSANTAAAITGQGEWATISPLNVNGGVSGTFDTAPITAASVTSTSIPVNACTWTGPNGGGSISIPSGTISSLSASTKYYVFRDRNGGGSFSATSSASTARARYNDTTARWLALGVWTTPASGSGGTGGGGEGGWRAD